MVKTVLSNMVCLVWNQFHNWESLVWGKLVTYDTSSNVPIEIDIFANIIISVFPVSTERVSFDC